MPLAVERSIVLPAGKNKRERWARLATEAARQSRRTGVMRIADLTTLEDAVAALAGPARGAGGVAWYMSAGPGATPVAEAMDRIETAALQHGPVNLTLFVGPEGGWSPREIQRFDEAGLTGVKLTPTILRVETAAVAAAAVVASVLAPRLASRGARCSAGADAAEAT